MRQGGNLKSRLQQVYVIWAHRLLHICPRWLEHFYGNSVVLIPEVPQPRRPTSLRNTRHR